MPVHLTTNRSFYSFLPVAAALFALAGCGASDTSQMRSDGADTGVIYDAQGPTLNPSSVGVYDRRAVLVAYYRSRHFQSKLDALRAERDAALGRGDAYGAKHAEARGEALQDLAHRQLAGEAPLDNIAQLINRDLPAIAHEAGVARIIARGGEAPDARTVDVTGLLERCIASAP